MRLLERDEQLAQLTESYGSALCGHGRLVLVHGEAGAGKTSLLRHFLDALPGDTTRLFGGCEPLLTARPFGPLADIADALPPAVATALDTAGRTQALFPDVLRFLRQPPHPKLLVIDDLHWADAGTLDLVRYLGRRIADVAALCVVAYRDDDIAADHPLRRWLGELPAATTIRIAVPCLSRAAVSALAQTMDRAQDDLFEITGGNPFFVTEVLNGRGGAVPPSVFDAIAGRMARLTPQARAFAELVAVSPKWIERGIMAELVDDADARVDECIEAGLLRVEKAWIAFRHELARQAAEQALLPGRRAELHRRVFAALAGGRSASGGLSRLIHHAYSAGLREEILELAPRAARAAAAASAHREAARHYALAIECAIDLEPAAQADLLESAADEYRLVSDVDATIAATRAALALRIALDDPLRQGMNLRRLAIALLEQGHRADAEASIARAVDLLATQAPSVELVRACAEQSRMRAWSDYAGAVRIGERALAMAESMADPCALVEALHACMSARMYLGDDRVARGQMERALGIAIDENLEDPAAQLFVALQLAGLIYRDHAYAIDVAERGLAYCEARDLDGYVLRLLDFRALSLTELGRWDEADRDMQRCLATPHLPERLRNSLLFLKARQAARRGAGSDTYWAALQGDPCAVPMCYRLPAVAAACAEAAWLRGDHAAARSVIRLGIDSAADNRDARLLGPLLVWARRCGVPVRHRALEIAAAHACELAGDIAGAAGHWQAHGCAYERALTLLHGDRDQAAGALAILDALGAKPAADIARRRLRQLGVRGIKRGPQPRTQADPHGLTARERQVHELLQQALSNAEIARRLHRSQRTVEHHVANVLAKLGFCSRSELRKCAG